MTAQPSRARLLNSDHELIAEGACVLDEPAGHASLEVERTPGVIHSQHGNLSLELDSGRSLLVSNKPMLLMISPPGQQSSQENRRKILRLRLVDPRARMKEQGTGEADGFDAGSPNLTQDAPRSKNVDAAAAHGLPLSEDRTQGSPKLTQDASAVDVVEQGSSAASEMGRLSAEGRGEAPAAR